MKKDQKNRASPFPRDPEVYERGEMA